MESKPKRQEYEYRKLNFRLGEIEKKVPHKGNILDVGCSFGFFLKVAQARGWKGFGIEVSEYASEYARKHFNLTVINKPFDKVDDFESIFFDAVTLWNVVEHLEDPIASLSKLFEMLRPGGVVVFTTGNI